MRTTISLKQNDLNLSSHVDLLILKFLTLLDSNVKLYITSAKTLHDTTLYSQIFSGLVLTFLMLCTSLVSLCLPHALFTLLLFSTPYAIWKVQLFYGLFFSSTNDLVLHAYSDVFFFFWETTPGRQGQEKYIKPIQKNIQKGCQEGHLPSKH